MIGGLPPRSLISLFRHHPAVTGEENGEQTVVSRPGDSLLAILLQGGFQEVSAVGVRGETVEAADPPCHQLGAERNKLEGEATSVSRQPDRKQPLAGAKKPILKELQKLGLIRNSASKSSGGVLKTVIKTRDGSKQDKIKNMNTKKQTKKKKQDEVKNLERTYKFRRNAPSGKPPKQQKRKGTARRGGEQSVAVA